MGVANGAMLDFGQLDGMPRPFGYPSASLTADSNARRDVQELEAKAIEIDGRIGARVVASIEVRPGTWRMLVLDRMDAPRCVTVSDAGLDDAEVDAIFHSALRFGHPDAVVFRERVADAEWGWIGITNALDAMASSGRPGEDQA